jgi:phospholipase C
MSSTDRRTFLKLMGTGALAASLPASIRRAVAVPAHNRTGTIQDVEHIVVLMQENRSFDHYFGTLRGVRGFADPRAVRLPSGKPVWNQPNGAGELLPFRPDVADVGTSFLPDPPHGWNDTHAAWNGGRHDQFVPNKGIDTMTYHTRDDIPFQYALADAFTVCDAYHCSLMGPTDPNRYHLWTGWVGNDGAAGGPVITNAEAGYDWSTYPERLEGAGISWMVYQDIGVGLTAEGFWGWTGDQPYIGNYGDNSLLYFHQYQNALPGNPLADKAKVGTNVGALGPAIDTQYRLFDMFRADVAAGNLPQVSWIVAPEAYSEHPNWAPDFGAWYVSQVLDILASNPEVWSQTVLFIDYDEEGGFFDHMVPPTPPPSADLGASTVSIVNEIYPGSPDHPSGPYGLGMRVPLLVVSPWSKGGWVNSQLFDHTSIIRFMEARFAGGNPDLIETNITPWRRAVVGDLTTAFDFATPDKRRVRLPDTTAFAPKNRDRHDDSDVVAPTDQALPEQERGIRPARALPYTLQARSTVDTGQGTVRIDFTNLGGTAAVFQVRSADPLDAPRAYTVGSHQQLSGSWNAADTTSGYDLSVYGPNGFFRGFKGGLAGDRANLEVDASYNRGDITLTIANGTSHTAFVRVVDQYSGQHTERSLRPTDRFSRRWTLHRTSGWYDLTITVASDLDFEYRLAGHVEDGRDSISDPGMGGILPHR